MNIFSQDSNLVFSLGKSADYPRYSTLFSRFGLKLIANTMTRYICILIFAIINNSLAQDDYSQAIEDIFIQNGSTTDFLGGFEEVTSPRSEGFGAVQKCGEGTDAGVHLCVDYYNCDADTRTIITSEEYDGTGLIDIRFGSNTCDDYLKVCCALPPSGVLPPELVTQPPTTGGQVTSAPVTPPTPPPVDVNTPEYCGIRNTNGIDFHITGNTNNEAEFGEFPWMLAILNKYPSTSDHLAVCGGSLIAPNVVLTGAHCVNTRTAGDLLVRAGEWDTQTERERYAYQERNIRTIIVHESFTTNNLFNDVALLILEEPFTRAPHIASICLPEQGTVFDSRECYTSGWGKNVFGLEGHYQVILKRIDLPTVPREKCQEDLRRTRLGHNFKLHNSFICAGGEAGKDACTGDGGSPLVCVDPNNPNRYLQAGIVAWGIGCGERDIPGVYADVGRFRSWIDQQLAAYNINPSSYTQ